MRHLLLLFLIFCSTSLYSQQKLIAKSTFKYNTSGLIEQVDSSYYEYAASNGFLDSNEPEFGFDMEFMNWFYTELIPVCDKEYRFTPQGAILPYDTISYALDAGLVISTESTFNPSRFLFTYNDNNDLLSEEKQVLYSFNEDYTSEEKMVYEYTTDGLLAVSNKYFGEDYLWLSSDSSFYNENGQLIEVAKNTVDLVSGIASPFFKYEMSYDGENVSNVKTYIASPQGNLYLLKWDLDYFYNGNLLDQILGENISDGITAVISYEYNEDQQVTQIESIQNLVAQRKIEFAYDANGFLSELRTFLQNEDNNAFYLDEEKFYYYSTSVNITETPSISWNIYPNPSSDYLMISGDDQLQNLQIFSADGRLVLQQKSHRVDIKHLAAGSYIINIHGTKSNFSAQFIKQ